MSLAMRLVGDQMRYDKVAYLITKPLASDSDDDLDYNPKPSVKKVKANIKRTNINFANGEMYDVTIVRVFGQYDADSIGLDDYDPDDQSTVHKIQKIGRHFQRTDFYIANGEVTFNAK